RIGVNTGEVVTGTGERLVTGDAVNVAARLEQAALPGDVLLSSATLAHVSASVEVERNEPLRAKGKAEPIDAYRLRGVLDESKRSHEKSFVGRGPELALMQEAWQRASRNGSCELITIVAEAGIGKSRLAAEFLAQSDLTVLRGRCLPYGDG